MPPAGQFGFETYIPKPLDGVVHFFSEGVRLLIKGYLVGGVSADWLRLNDGDGVQVVEVDGGVIFKPPADKRIAGPFDFDEVGDTCNTVFPCDF